MVKQVPPVPQGAYAPSIIVLLTDGASNAGPELLIAAQKAVDRGVRVYTIGYGTAFGGEFVLCAPRFQGNEPFRGGGSFGGGSGGGGRFRRGIDEVTLQQIADMTGDIYYSAGSSNELQEVFASVPTNIIVEHNVTEISVFFAAAGALLAVLAIAISILWHPLP